MLQGMKESSEPCPYCGKVFSTKSSLEPHIEMVHKGVRKECEVCGKVLSDLWKHMRTVHGQGKIDAVVMEMFQKKFLLGNTF